MRARLVAETIEKFGSLDCLVNNAGDSGPTAPVQDYPLDDWHYTINSCLTSTYLCARFAVPAMIAAGRGAIVNIASMAGRRGLAVSRRLLCGEGGPDWHDGRTRGRTGASTTSR